MSNELAIIEPLQGSLVIGMPSQQELMVYQTWAKNAAESQMYRNVGKEAGIMMIMLAAREYGIGPAQALNGGLHIIEGKVELSARVMSALIRRAKHELKIIEMTDKKCTIQGTRIDTRETHTVSYTIEQAQNAGLIKDKGGWKKNPEDMLYARAISRLARQLFSDVIGIGYIEGEISDCRANIEVLEGVVESPVESVQIENLLERIEDLLAHFPKDDHLLLSEFVQAVADHYKWTKGKVIDEFIKNLDLTRSRFDGWKEKRKTNV